MRLQPGLDAALVEPVAAGEANGTLLRVQRFHTHRAVAATTHKASVEAPGVWAWGGGWRSGGLEEGMLAG